MRIIYGCVLFCLTSVISGYSQERCKSTVEHTISQSPEKGYTIALQSSENLRNVEVELYDLYEGKTVDKKYVGNGLRSKQTVFSRVKPSLYLIYIKHDGCPRAESLGGVKGIKVGNIE
jgi:hypothetical protein